MKHFPKFEIPDELTLLEFFGVAPSESISQDGYWCYEIMDEDNNKLRLSFNILERSVQTVFYASDREIAKVLQEGAIRMFIKQYSDREVLTCQFKFQNADSSLEIEIRPKIKLHLATLVNE